MGDFVIKEQPYLFSHTFVYVHVQELSYADILFGACRNEGNHCEITIEDNQRIFRNTNYSKALRFRSDHTSIISLESPK